ncbi:TetR family transcriptional regulator [Streptomyces longispororuber]|uniref:TetR family transcriptional regulator n=1 Tax=Streptomyces longispororuber TaxID=68230 RepID=A0A918ZBR9_9ACTN|nr:TetR family transcriptional regulator [Streptomyces longispororuber]
MSAEQGGRENEAVAAEERTEGPAEARPEPKKRGVGRPRRIGPDAIVGVARRILREEGVEALSMRRVAKEVGATPMALYHHVRDKDELLMLALEGTAATLPRPELPADPRERMVAVAVHMHAVLEELPWVVEVLRLGGLTDRGALWMVEELVGAGIACGLTPEEAVHAYATLWHCVYGSLVYRRAVARRAAGPDRERYFPGMLSGADAGELPHLTALADRWTELTASYDVGVQLRAVVDGLLGPRGGRPSPAPFP